MGDRGTFGQRWADRVAAFSGRWLFVGLHTAWFVLWFALRLDINLLTLIVSLEAIYLSTIVLMSQNRAGERSQVQQDTIERAVRLTERVAEADHVRHGELLEDLHAHVSCEGHTTIGEGGDAGPVGLLPRRGADGRFVKAG